MEGNEGWSIAVRIQLNTHKKVEKDRMTSSNFEDHKEGNKRKLQFSKSGIPLHQLDDIQYMEFAMEFPDEIVDPEDDNGTAWRI